MQLFIHAQFAQEGRLPMALAALFALTPCQAGSPPVQMNKAAEQPVRASTGLLNAAQPWKEFKTFWGQIDRNTGPMFHHQQALAQRFGLQEASLQQALRKTEQRATGAPADPSTVLVLGDYALASLAWFRIQVSTFEEMPIMTRMAVPPPSIHVLRQLQDMETVDQRVDQLRDLKGRNAINSATFLQALDGLRMEVYRHCVLRTAALAHMRSHQATDAPAPGTIAKDLAMLSDFYQHPEKSAVGSPAWFQKYQEATLRIVEDAEKATDPKLGALLKRRHQALVESLKRLEAFTPKLEALFAELEK